jgi:fibro-slime domain-containing protein
MKTLTDAKRKNTIGRIFGAALVGAVILGSALPVIAQTYPETLWVPVTYYDFRSNGSNPEFEQNHHSGVYTGMVATTLDAERKPTPGSVINYNQYIKYWFRPWSTDSANKYGYSIHAQGDSTKPSYSDNGWIYNGPTNIHRDTAFKNYMIKDSLPFRYVPNSAGLYQFQDDNFFPLDNRGFGKEGKSHNYAFAMSIHSNFTQKRGLTFNFTGDDDVWTFINNRLQLDLGGIHNAQTKSFNTDTITGLVNGAEYDFDFFFAERHTTESHIWITTNIVSTHIATKVTIVAEPPTATILAGQTARFIGQVWYDSITTTGDTIERIDKNLSNQIHWTPSPVDARSSLSPTDNDTSFFTSTRAWQSYTITAIYANFGDPVSASIVVTVLPNVAKKLVIEASSDTSSLAKKQNKQPIDTVTIGPVTPSVDVFAIQRDTFDNFVNFSKQTDWAILSGAASINSVVGEQNNVGRGRIMRNVQSGYGRVSADDRDFSGLAFIDSVVVRVRNDAPVAVGERYTVGEDQLLTVPSAGRPSLLANDIDAPGTALTSHVVTTVPSGQLTPNNDGSFTFFPAQDFTGRLFFTYRIYDGEFYSNTVQDTIDIGSENDPPVVSSKQYFVNEDDTLRVLVGAGVLQGASDPENNSLTAILDQNVASGTLALTSNGSFTYVPVANRHDTITFTFHAWDGQSSSNIATATIIVLPLNDKPVAVVDTIRTNEDTDLNLSARGILINDVDIDGDVLTAVKVTEPTRGTLVLNSNGSLTYSPPRDSNGTYSFTYRAKDATDSSNSATVYIIVAPINDMPVGSPDNYTVNEDDSLVVAAPGVLANDNDVDRNSLTAIQRSSPASGTLRFNGNGSFVYKPIPNFTGTVNFNYQATDGITPSADIGVLIFVLPVNDKPVARTLSYSTPEDSPLNVPVATGLLQNPAGIDIDGTDPLTVVSVSAITADKGTLAVLPDGSFLYTPALNYNSSFTFTYRVNDGTVDSDPATVTIFVGATNDAPVAVRDSFAMNEDDTLRVTAPGILANDQSIDGDPIHAVPASNPAQGALTLNQDGSFTYIPPINYNGTVKFTYQAADATLSSNTDTVIIVVRPRNDAPVARNAVYGTGEDVDLNVPMAGVPSLMSYVTDVDNAMDTVKVVSTVSAAQGTLTLQPFGAFLFHPASNFNGAATFTYRAYDSADSSAIATVTITVRAVNDAPIITAIPDQTTPKGTPFPPVSLDTYVADADNPVAQLTWTSVSDTTVLVTVNPGTHITTVTPRDSLWDGTAKVIFKVTDPAGLMAVDTVLFTVTRATTVAAPVTDTLPGTYRADRLSMNLRVPGYAGSMIYYATSTNGTEPADPRTTPTGSMTGSGGLLNFGPFAAETTMVKVTAYAKQYPNESSPNASFTYVVAFPQLPNVTATPAPGSYDTTLLAVSLAVTGHSDATIYYTLDGSDPATSTTRIMYATGTPVQLGPFTTATSVTIRAFGRKTGYRAGSTTMIYSFNPQRMSTPVATPPGQTFYADSFKVTLAVPGATSPEIRYTTDGSTPTLTSNIYRDTLMIRENTTLKAIAVKDGVLPGPVMTEVYTKSIPDSMGIYPHPDSTKPYPAAVAWKAGAALPLTARIFDQYGTRLNSFETATAPITWAINEITGANTGTLSTSTGSSTVFTPFKAYQTTEVIATFSRNGVAFTAKVTVMIEPGVAYRLWLEADNERLVSQNAPMPIDTVRLSSTKLVDTVYAVIRDSLGNYVGTSQATTWSPATGAVATAHNGRDALGEGLIDKQTSAGTINAAAVNTNLSLKYPSDTVAVKVLAYWYDSLRIVVKDSSIYAIDSIAMNTNQDTSIQVFGHRDDGLGAGWERISAKWEILDPQIDYKISAAPGAAHVWTLSPNDTGTGRLAVSLGDPTKARPDTIKVHFTPGPPARVVMEAMTAPDSMIAGKPINVKVKLLNADNKVVYGTWTFAGTMPDSALYTGLLRINARPQPTIIVDGVTMALNTPESAVLRYAQEAFREGLDTISITLFYAPFKADSLHTLRACLGPTLTTELKLRLLPGKLDSIAIEDLKGAMLDSLTLRASQKEYIVLATTGYDQYGNKLGAQKSNWVATDSLHPIERPNNTQQIYYTSERVLYNEQGYVFATAVDTSGGKIVDSLKVRILGPGAVITSSITRDLDGDGYLDAVVVTFNKPVVLPESFFGDSAEVNRHFSIANLPASGISTDFSIEMIRNSRDSTDADSVYIISLEENRENAIPQTNWTLYMNLIEPGNAIEPVVDAIVADGAGPVIWTVTKITSSVGDRTGDRVMVVLSEPFVNGSGNPFPLTPGPNSVLKAWVTSGDSLAPDDSVLNAIDKFYGVNGDTLVFYMTNGAELTGNHFFSINTDGKYISDTKQNPVSPENQHVRVIVRGALGVVAIGPNPIAPIMQHFEEELSTHDPVQAAAWARQGGGMIATDFVLPISSDFPITGALMIFDAVGNLVYTKKNDRDLIPANWRTDWVPGSTRQLIFYWNGITDSDLKAAAGVYRVVVYLKYKTQSNKFTGNLGIGR